MHTHARTHLRTYARAHTHTHAVLPLYYFIKQDHAERAARRDARAAAAPGRAAADRGAAVKLEAPKLASLKREASAQDPAGAGAVRVAGGPGREAVAAAAGPSVGALAMPPECSAQVIIRAVGDCDGTAPLGTFAQPCDGSALDAHRAIFKYVAQDITGYHDVREFRTAEGLLLDGQALVHGSAFYPREVWALRSAFWPIDQAFRRQGSFPRDTGPFPTDTGPFPAMRQAHAGERV